MDDQHKGKTLTPTEAKNDVSFMYANTKSGHLDLAWREGTFIMLFTRL